MFFDDLAVGTLAASLNRAIEGMGSPSVQMLGFGFCVSLAMALLLGWVGRWGRVVQLLPRNDLSLQAQHQGKVPRLGGVAIVITFAVIISADSRNNLTMASWLMISSTPLILLAFLEDIGRHVAPKIRLTCTFFCAFLYCSFFSDIILRTEFSLFDAFLAYPLVSLLVSTFLISSMTQAMNLIDGLHGLSSGVATLGFTAIAAIASLIGQDSIALIASIAAAAAFGFFIVNYPSGFLFLGDTGAYWLGFMLAVLSLEMLSKNSYVSPYAIMLVLFWPIFDFATTVVRRLYSRSRLFAPDTMHPHHVAVRLMRTRAQTALAMSLANPAASTIIMILASGPVGLGVTFWNNDTISMILFSSFFSLYTAIYAFLLIRERKCQWPWPDYRANNNLRTQISRKSDKHAV